MKEDHIRNIFLDIILTLLTCSLFNIYVQYKQIIAINEMLKEERYSFLKWLLFTIFTFGLYHIYHEYVKGEDVGKSYIQKNIQQKMKQNLENII